MKINGESTMKTFFFLFGVCDCEDDVCIRQDDKYPYLVEYKSPKDLTRKIQKAFLAECRKTKDDVLDADYYKRIMDGLGVEWREIKNYGYSDANCTFNGDHSQREQTSENATFYHVFECEFDIYLTEYHWDKSLSDEIEKANNENHHPFKTFVKTIGETMRSIKDGRKGVRPAYKTRLLHYTKEGWCL